MMLGALSGAILLSACATPTGGEPVSSGPAEQKQSSPAQQKQSSSADEKTSSPLAQKPASPAERKLSLGMASYDNGNFESAAAEIRNSLHLGLSKHDQVVAHKYLAFIYCVSKRATQCREEFRKALRIDPAFELEPAEAGHPIWGPVFQGEKSRYRKTPQR